MWRINFCIIVFLVFTSKFYGNSFCEGRTKNGSVPFYTGNSEKKLQAALSYLESVCGKDGIIKVVVLKDGEMVFEGTESKVVQNVWSCTKSFTSTVLGLLIAEGKCSPDDKVCHFIPELKEHYPELTFRHLTTHTSGYRAAGDDAAGGHGQSSTPFEPSPEPLFAPGTEFRYWDSAMNLFAKALTAVAGEPIEHYFKRKVAEPIGMTENEWDWKDFGEINGVTVNGGAGNKGRGIHISATEMAKFGQLFLNKGKWENSQIIPEKWVEEATSPQIHAIVPGNTIPYGFNWWTSGTFPDAPEGTFAAKGFNNNICLVIPEKNLVVVRLGLDGNIEDEKWNRFIQLLMKVD
jgi:CubicO group peptidase (beta-lactamase class C family)